MQISQRGNSHVLRLLLPQQQLKLRIHKRIRGLLGVVVPGHLDTWTPEEDAKLNSAVEKWGEESIPVDWAAIAAYFPCRTKKQCQKSEQIQDGIVS
jgi:hypothetical protein